MKKLILVLVVLAAGCRSTELSPEWRPLEKIQESWTMSVGLSTGGCRTVDDTIYVRNLSVFLKKNPEPKLSCVLAHEKVHAERQRDYGLSQWVWRYLHDTDFMWAEEQIGWYRQLQEYKRFGLWVRDLSPLADSLSRYRNLSGPMVSRTRALAWLKEVMAGTWTPPD
jgi:hypothetical protein